MAKKAGKSAASTTVKRPPRSKKVASSKASASSKSAIEVTEGRYPVNAEGTDEVGRVNESLLAVTTANLQALRSRAQADARATGNKGRAAPKTSASSEQGTDVIGSDQLIAALDKLEAAYRELLQS